jgi:photosystem II oxygen-evolving enhancer protein 3
MSTMKQAAILVPCFVLGCVGALALTAPQAAVQHSIARVLPAQIVGATVAAAAVAGPALADATPVDVFDYRNVRDGYEIIYQARDLDLPQNTRDGFTQARDPAVASARISESVSRLQSVGDLIKKAYWTAGREELRGQVGTLRFDINTIASGKASAADKKAILAAKDDLFATIDKLDFAMRKKDQASASKFYEQVVAKASAIAKA